MSGPELDLGALDRQARFERASRLLGWVAIPLGFATLLAAVFASVLALAFGIAGTLSVVRTAIVLVAAPIPTLAMLTHYRLLRRVQDGINGVFGQRRSGYTLAWTARILATLVGMCALYAAMNAPDLGALLAGNWPIRAVLLCLATLGGYSVVLPLVLRGPEHAEARRRGRNGSAPWLVAIALVASLLYPQTPEMWMFALVAGLYAMRVLLPEVQAVSALEQGDAERALWWCDSMPALTGPYLRVRTLAALDRGDEASAEARRALTSWAPVRDAARLLAFLAHQAAARGEHEAAWELGLAAAHMNPNLPAAYAALAAADLYAGQADARTLELVERAREHADRGFPAQPGRRGPEFRALHAWALAETGNLPGSREASAGARGELVTAHATTRAAAEVYLARCTPSREP